MPKLSNVTLKAMALTGNPANRRPIHAMKSAFTEAQSMTAEQVEKADFDEAQHPRDDHGRFGAGGGGGKGGKASARAAEHHEDGKESAQHDAKQAKDKGTPLSADDHKEKAERADRAAERFGKMGDKDLKNFYQGAAAGHRELGAALKKSVISTSQHYAANTQDEPMTNLPEPSTQVLKALSEVKLSKAAHDDEHRAAAEAIGRLLAAHPGLTHDDVLSVAKAAGVDVAKGTAETEDEDEELEEETDEVAQDKKGKFKKGNPWAEKMKKSAPQAAAAPLDEVLKSTASVEVRKAVEAMRQEYEQRIAKNERELAEERDHRLSNLIKSEVTTSFKNLGTDHVKLAGILKHARETGKGSHASDLLQVLKAADAQIGLAQKSGGSAFQSVGKSTQFGSGGGTAMGQINAMVDAMVQKGEVKKSRPQLVDDVLMTPQGQSLWAQHCEERGF